MIDDPKKFIPLWIGAAFLGVTFVAINTSLKGDVLAHQIKMSSPKIIFTEEKFNHEINKIGINKNNIQTVNSNDLINSKELDETLIADSALDTIRETNVALTYTNKPFINMFLYFSFFAITRIFFFLFKISL